MKIRTKAPNFALNVAVQFGINSTRDVWKFAKLDSPLRLVQFWQNFQTSLVLLIPNCTRHCKITYTNNRKFDIFLLITFFYIWRPISCYYLYESLLNYTTPTQY
jgi:hypothetical protein